MRTVHISENIGFQCRIDRDKPHTAYQLGVIAYLAGAQHDFIPEKVEVAIHFLHHFIAYRQRTTAGESTTTFPQKSDDRVLYHLGIHLERRNIGIAAQETQHGVGDVSYPRLYREEFRRNKTGFELRRKKVAHIASYVHRYFIAGGKLFHSIREIGFYNSYNFSRVDLNIGNSYTVGWTINGYLPTMRRIGRLINIMESRQLFGIMRIYFYDDFSCQLTYSWSDSHTGTQYDFPVIGYRCRFDNGDVDFSQKTVTQHLRQFREMHIAIGNLAGIDSRTGIGTRLIRGTELYRLSTGQSTIETVAGRGSGKNADTERTAGCVLFFGPAGDCLRDYFGSSGSRKSAESYIIVIMNVQRGFFGRNNFKTHIRIFSILIFPIQYFRSDNSPP